MNRPPLAQALTLDFNLVTVRNAARGRLLLELLSDAEVSALCDALGVRVDDLAALLDALGARIAALEAAPPGGSSAVLKGSVTVDFGAGDDTASVSVSEPGVVAGRVVSVCPAYEATADHDPDDVWVEGLRVCVGAVTPGLGFSVVASAPFGTWGRYAVNYLVA